jgi:hypothetical protein
VLGGYDGANIVGDVVSTVDGTSFTKVGTLPVPVRYPAIAVLRNAIYLFGGVASTRFTMSTSGSSPSSPRIPPRGSGRR